MSRRLLRAYGGLPGWGKLATAAAAAVVVIAVGIAVGASQGGPRSAAASARQADSTHAASVLGADERAAREWIREHLGAADNVAANVSDVQLAISQLRRSPT